MIHSGITPTCPRCGKKVYFAEQVIAVNRHWHKTCFKCVQCQTALDSRNCSEHQGEVYCKQCHGRQFGLKGYGYGVGAGILNMDSRGLVDRGQQCRKTQSSYDDFTPPSTTNSGKWKNPVFSDLCGRCGKRTYAAEKILAGGSAYHRSTCFKCSCCDKLLQSTTLAEHKNEIYCKTCYGRKFSIKGYGYGVGAGCLSLDKDSDNYDVIPSNPVSPSARKHFLSSRKYLFKSFEDTLSEKCYRCGKAAFAAEKSIAAGHVWHNSCFTCFTCGKRLETTILAERHGDIYCKVCYGRQFGPKGFGNGLITPA